MTRLHPKRICLVPRLSGVGGMVSFQHKLRKGLEKRGFQICDSLADEPYQAVLVIGGTRQLTRLWRLKQRGVRLVQRLDGMNWIHRVQRQAERPGSGLRHFLRAEYGNLILGFIRSNLAGHVVYQSQFSRQWWERARGPARVPCSVVYNGVDLEIFSPGSGLEQPPDRYRLLMVEGSLMGGYELGLEVAVQLGEQLAKRLEAEGRLPQNGVELMVTGRVAPGVQKHWQERAAIPLVWSGLAPHEKIPEIDRSAHLLYSADVNAACPNAVIEALACGLPVLSFDTGALPELVRGEAGRVVAYGGDPWRLDPPDVPAITQAALEILQDLQRFRTGARQRAEQVFGVDKMVEGYLQALLEY